MEETVTIKKNKKFGLITETKKIKDFEYTIFTDSKELLKKWQKQFQKNKK